ncbi:MAG TPA: putative quinol monooxygenase [Terracidiphilus sp.]|jgi:quinol monooxygenase YgiN
MEPVRLIVRIVAQDGKADEVKGFFRRMVRPTRAERGCRYYELFESNLPGLLFLHELWNSKEDLDAHRETSHFKELIPAATKLMKEPMEVNFLSEIE